MYYDKKPCKKDNVTERPKKKTKILAYNLESKSTEFRADVKSINPVLYNSPNDLKTQIRWHEQVEQAKKVTKIKCQDKVKISNDGAKYRTDFKKMLSNLESICESHLDQTEAAQHRVQSWPEDTRPIHS